ncbi:MAG: hypothetical protein CME19_21475 [Gemmatimonadetes bacterium]|nr:hypothetical protein [Gemmatimonadota bacterium]
MSHLSIDTVVTPPEWAMLERLLIDAQVEAIAEFQTKYFDSRGYLLCIPRWGGNDGPDDAAENMLNWTVLYALGADRAVLDRYRVCWEGHLQQYTEAKTVEVEMARDGMYYKEFPVMFDWYHHGEWLSSFILEGLADPGDRIYNERLRRFAGLYMNEDPQAKNYDPEHKIIRSLFNGSRGPLLRKATALDWAGDPVEIEGRFRPGHGEGTFAQMLDHFKDYNDVVGDHPLNLGATTLGFNAYALTGESKYRDWMLEYTDAWVERTKANNDLIPSNIGLDGTIGGEADGKWYGGCYGWGFSVINPANGEWSHRPACLSRTHYSFANALLMTGDFSYLELWRKTIDIINSNAKEIDGQTQYPRGYGDDGWYEYKPEPFSTGAFETYYWSQDPADRERAGSNPWQNYLDGKDDSYAVKALHCDLSRLQTKRAMLANDLSTPDCRMSDDMNRINPATTDALIRLMLGGLPTGRDGYPLHCRVRYFAPDRQRSGLPEDVAALVTSMDADSTTIELVNLNQVTARQVIVQGGAYGEHQITSASTGGETASIDDRFFSVDLAPASGCEIKIGMKRYANSPTLAFPWS